MIDIKRRVVAASLPRIGRINWWSMVEGGIHVVGADAP